MPRTESGLHGDIFFLVMLFLLLPPAFSEPVDHLGLSEEPIIYVYQMTQMRGSYTNQALSKLKSPAPSHTSISSPNQLGQAPHTPLFLLSLGGSQPPYFPSLTHQAKGSQSSLRDASGEREGLSSCRGVRYLRFTNKISSAFRNAGYWQLYLWSTKRLMLRTVHSW